MSFHRRSRSVIRALWMTAAFCLAGRAEAALHFTQPVIELGKIRIGQFIEHRFDFVNEGPGAILPVEVKASCGCLLPIIEQRSFVPGEKGRLTLKINTLSASPGPHIWKVQVYYQEEGRLYEVSLAVHAHVLQEIAVTPPAMMIYAAGPIQHQISLTDFRSRTFSILGVEGSSEHLQAKVSAEFMDQAGHVVRQISLQVGPSHPSGRFDEQLIIYTSDPQYHEIRVPITVVKRAEGKYTALPGKVEVAASRNQMSPSRMITVRDARGRTVTIDKVLADHPAVTCQWAQGANTVGTIKVTVDASALASSSLDSQIHIHFGSEENEVLHIPVHCVVR